jgi:hypothetical protein
MKSTRGIKSFVPLVLFIVILVVNFYQIFISLPCSANLFSFIFKV